jgi:branched-subunit amino acid ABC-type transport system permease component
MVSVWRPGAGAINFLAAISAVLAVAALTGVAMYVLVERFGGRFGHFVGTVITIAATIALHGIMSLIWGAQTWRMPLVDGNVLLFGLTFPAGNLSVLIFSAAILLVVLLLLARTTIGIDMQAIACNPVLARLRGISVQRTLCVVWVLATLLAALSGIMIASVSVVSLEGAIIGVSAIVAALIGGMTSIPFAIVGALLLAGCETLVTLFGEPRYSQVIPVICLMLLLIVRPTGLASQSEHIARV